MMNVFVKKGARVRHFYGSERLYAPEEKGQNARGRDWYPKIAY